MTHELKCWPEFFQAAWVGVKTFEIRKNDRNFNVHDEIVLEEYDPIENDYTGRTIDGVITYISQWKQTEGYIVFAFNPTGRSE